MGANVEMMLLKSTKSKNNKASDPIEDRLKLPRIEIEEAERSWIKDAKIQSFLAEFLKREAGKRQGDDALVKEANEKIEDLSSIFFEQWRGGTLNTRVALFALQKRGWLDPLEIQDFFEREAELDQAIQRTLGSIQDDMDALARAYLSGEFQLEKDLTAKIDRELGDLSALGKASVALAEELLERLDP